MFQSNASMSTIIRLYCRFYWSLRNRLTFAQNFPILSTRSSLKFFPRRHHYIWRLLKISELAMPTDRIILLFLYIMAVYMIRHVSLLNFLIHKRNVRITVVMNKVRWNRFSQSDQWPRIHQTSARFQRWQVLVHASRTLRMLNNGKALLLQ